jgi:hypothetical protein
LSAEPIQLNRMTSAPSPEGRRILVAVVTGPLGEQIQAWREQHDSKEAGRLPPHATLCYWAPDGSLDLLGCQVQHAFRDPVVVRLGHVQVGDNDQRTLYVEVENTVSLDAALRRLYDETHVKLPRLDHWRWHVTCVRESRDRDLHALLEAARSLDIQSDWRVDKISYMQLRGDRYHEVVSWSV